MALAITTKDRLKNLMWVGIFFLVLSTLTLPVILLSANFNFSVDMSFQALIVIATTLIVMVLRKERLNSVWGQINMKWFTQLLKGVGIGAVLMLLPALFLLIGGWATWQISGFNISAILQATLLMISVAIAEELMFRGFIFQRLIKAIGQWPAQLVIAAYFLLIHMNNPGMHGITKVFAMVNIFLASIMFGLAAIRYKSLSSVIGIHFMANWVQGTLLGFAVSGNSESSFLLPAINKAPIWLTGGEFGLEASLPGLICVMLTILFLYRMKDTNSSVAP